MGYAKRTHHISVVMNDEERRQLDDWMDARVPRLRSRSEAIRQLISQALTAPRPKRPQRAKTAKTSSS